MPLFVLPVVALGLSALADWRQHDRSPGPKNPLKVTRMPDGSYRVESDDITGVGLTANRAAAAWLDEYVREVFEHESQIDPRVDAADIEQWAEQSGFRRIQDTVDVVEGAEDWIDVMEVDREYAIFLRARKH